MTPMHQKSLVKEKEQEPVDDAGSQYRYPLMPPHRSALPALLYLFSFAKPLPSLWRSPAAFFSHPYVLYALGVINALYAGACIASIDLLYGYWSQNTDHSQPPDNIRSFANKLGWICTVLGVTVLFACWAFNVCFTVASRKLCDELRRQYFAAVLAQDPVFHQRKGPGEILTHTVRDIATIQGALGEKAGFLINATATLISCLVTAFSRSARIAGMLLTVAVFTGLVLSITGYVSDRVTDNALGLDGRMSTYTEQVLGSIRVVQSFSIADALIQRMQALYMHPLTRIAWQRALTKGIDMGALYFMIQTLYALAFWWGSVQIGRGHEEVKDVISSFFNYLNGLFTLAMVLPQLQSVLEGVTTLQRMRRDIEHTPRIDIRSTEGVVPGAEDVSREVAGYIPRLEMDHVTFAYPTRPYSASLSDVSITFEPGQVTALVGPSGSGKSTITSLLIREYDPETANLPEARGARDEARRARRRRAISDAEKDAGKHHRERVHGGGSIRLGGIDLRDLNLRWLRSQVAVVRQNPQLLSGTVLENVATGLSAAQLGGLPGTPGAHLPDEKKLRGMVQEALEKAEAWDFVCRLPQGMDTFLAGGQSVHLSGGQRQRIAIARALVRDPQILVLDEATSALDTATEDKIKRSLEKEQERRGMTTIIVAHRLSTVQHADKIVAMQLGRVVEEGTHEELMGHLDGTYRRMVMHNRRAAGLDADDKNQDEAANSEAETAAPSPNLSRKPPPENKDASKESSPDAKGSNPPEAPASAPAEVPAEASASKDLEAPPLPVLKPKTSTFWAVTAGNRILLLLGAVFTLVLAASFPVMGYLSGRAIAAFNIKDVGRMRSKSNDYALGFFVIAIIDLLLAVTATFFLEWAAERVMRYVKVRSLRVLTHQEVAFFDKQSHSSGALGASIFTHATSIGASLGMVATQLIMCSGNLIGAMIMALVISPRMAAVTVPAVVLMLGTSVVNVVQLEAAERVMQEPLDLASTHISESMDAIATVISLGLEGEALVKLDDLLRPRRSYLPSLALGSLGFAGSQFGLYGTTALMMFWGAHMLSEYKVDSVDMFGVFEGVFVGMFAAMRLTTYIPDVARARHALGVVGDWWRREPQVASLLPPDGHAPAPEGERDIEFRDVELRYPTRPEVPALQDLSLTIPEQSTVAFCGTSGSGKTSTLGLLQRFYEPSRGTIYYGGQDIRSIPIKEWREYMAYVSQDPVLYEGSVRWNLLLGAINPSRVTDAEIERVCRQACVWDFATKLPEGLDTTVGLKGGSLSGGQRQRLCIARALLRRPRILLLDEATSALDAESEVLVQQALDNASRECTMVTIAHRLSTIRKADIICVVEGGRIVESGSHEELIRKHGRYFELVEAQL